MILPKKKNEFTVEKVHRVTRKVSTLEELRKNTFNYVPVTYGYVEPGHGMRGKKWWFKDLFKLYEIYNGKKEILLWSSKEKHSCEPANNEDEPSNKCAKTGHESHEDKWLKLSALRKN